MCKEVSLVIIYKFAVMGERKEKNGRKRDFRYIFELKTGLLNEIMLNKVSFLN